jgi:hypothetical protein
MVVYMFFQTIPMLNRLTCSNYIPVELRDLRHNGQQLPWDGDPARKSLAKKLRVVVTTISLTTPEEGGQGNEKTRIYG